MAIKLSNNKKRRLTALADQAMALAGQGQFTKALQICDQADALSPDYPDVMYARGLVAGVQQDYDAASEWFGRAHRASPKRVDFMTNYAGCLLLQDRVEDAATLYREVLRLAPRVSEASFGLGASLAAVGELREAVSVFESALASIPNQVMFLKKLAAIRNDFGEVDAALELLEKAHAIAPNDVSVLYSLGICLSQKGEMSVARERLRTALALNPDYAEALNILVNSGDYQERSQDIESLRRLYERVSSESREREVAAFALGTAADKEGNYANAFALWSEGNRIRRQRMHCDEQDQATLHDTVKSAFPVERFQQSIPVPLTDIAPIFVVGMPRSGSTLLEQALSRHPALQAGGELNAMQQSIAGRGHKVRIKGLIEVLRHADESQLAAIGHDYARRLQHEYGLQGRVVDKALSNYLYAGLIARAIPNAKVIHVAREPMASCLSIYQQNFVEDIPYAFDLGEMGRQYARYLKLMQHWRNVLPEGVLLEVSYEELVDQPEQELRRLLAACGLEWDAQCLSAHEAKGAVATASVFQVRKPIHRHSVDRWRRYSAQLEPLKKYFD